MSPTPHPRWAIWLATGLGAGYLPVMPGTYGSALGVLLYLALAELASRLPWGPWFLCFAVLLLAGLALCVISAALPHFSSEDPTPIILDEVAGQAVTLLAIAFFPQDSPSTWTAIGAGFVLFRALDVVKPFPIWKLGHLRGAWGVLADDLGAGVLAALLLFALGQAL